MICIQITGQNARPPLLHKMPYFERLPEVNVNAICWIFDKACSCGPYSALYFGCSFTQLPEKVPRALCFSEVPHALCFSEAPLHAAKFRRKRGFPEINAEDSADSAALRYKSFLIWRDQAGQGHGDGHRCVRFAVFIFHWAVVIWFSYYAFKQNPPL